MNHARTNKPVAARSVVTRGSRRVGGDRRQREAEGASRAQHAIDPDPPAMSQHDTFGNVEPKSHASSVFLSYLLIALKDGVQLGLGDAFACVRNGETQLITDAFDADHNLTLRRGELDSVVDEVDEHLKD